MMTMVVMCHDLAWEDRLLELADYRKIHGNCNIPQRCSENTKLACRSQTRAMLRT
jgi:hypothetical protein